MHAVAGAAPTSPPAVVGRHQEIARVREMLADPSESLRGLVLEGEAGIGKSTVWSAGVALATTDGWTVLTARGSQAEADLSFAALSDLLEPVFDDVADRLPEPQRAAMEVALVRRLPTDSPVGAREIGAGLLAVLRTLCADRRVLLAVDDWPWLDRASLDVLRFALRRMQATPLRVLASRRTGGGPVPDDKSGATGEPVEIEGIDEVGVGPLGPLAVDQLLANRLALRLPARILEHLVGQAGGNPFWALQLGATLIGSPMSGAYVTVPQSLSLLVAQRLAELAPPTREALLVTSALPAPPVSLALRALEPVVDDAAGAVDDAVAAGVVVESNGRLRPVHPLLGAAALDGLPPVARSGLHRRLARVVTDPEQRARHLALTAEGPDRELARALDEGAAAARRRGAMSSATELADLAVRFTPPDDAAALALRRTDAAELHYSAGDHERVCELAEAVWSAPDLDPAVQRRVGPLLTYTLLHTRGQVEAEQMAASAIERSGDDPLLRSSVLAAAANITADPEVVRPYALEAIALCEQLGDEADQSALATALHTLAEIEMFAGHGYSRELSARAAAAETRLGWIPFTERAEVRLGLNSKVVDDLDTSRDALTRTLQAAQDEAELSTVPVLLGHLAMTEVWAGRYGIARDVLMTVDDAQRQAGPGIGEPASLICARALVTIMAGDLDAARTLITDAASQEAGSPVKEAALDAVLGMVMLLQGDNEQAVTVMTRGIRIAREAHFREPGMHQRSEGDLGQALVNTGRMDEAAALAAEMRELGAPGRPTLTGIALRIEGLVQAARGELDDAAATLNRAVQEHARSQLALERGRSLLALGQVHRRRTARGEAREALQGALDCFTDLDARPFMAIADAELHRGRRARSGSKLTNSERQVAELVATGMTNREVSAQLFTSVRTVEGHLASIYRKLGVRSRTELTSRFAGLDR